MTSQFTDAATISGTRRTNDGYLVADVRCARAGCQDYAGADFGLVGGTVTVYRPESAVFAKDSLATFAGKPVTVNHPPEMVTADNWKQYAAGDIGTDFKSRRGRPDRPLQHRCEHPCCREPGLLPGTKWQVVTVDPESVPSVSFPGR